LQKHGIDRALINAGGDLIAGDPPPEREGWRLGVAPLQPDQPPSRLLVLANCGVATSGDAWQYVELEGQRYSHIVDPRTGIGLTRRSSVTVVARDGMVGDGLASAISVLGPEKGLRLVEQYPDAACRILTVQEGKPVEHTSKGWSRLPEYSPEDQDEPQP
jgi:thiamine biosynthesis lipoprotein